MGEAATPTSAELRPPAGPGGGSLYGRFYLYTLLICFIALLISFIAITVGRRGEWHRTMRRFAGTVAAVTAEQITPHLDDGRAPEILTQLAARFEANVALLSRTGQIVATSGSALNLPEPRELRAAENQGFSVHHHSTPWLPGPLEALALRDPRDRWSVIPIQRGSELIGFLQFSPAHPPETTDAIRLAWLLASTLALVALLMVPATRSITGPLERLTASARRFATGDFAHRVPVEGPREIGRLGSEMNEMAERLSVLLHTQRQLLADVSHELRSPLARIEVALELARTQGGAEKPLESIASDVDELIHMVQDILTKSRLELRPDLVRLRPVTAAALLDEAREKALAAGLDEALLAVRDDTSGRRVQADADLVGHALNNLLDNARKHSPGGTAITLGGRLEGERLLLFVEDRGPGIPPAEVPRLFEPFYRPDGARTRGSGGGAGLGLSLVRRIAELHGAKPYVRSTLGEGSIFGITVPIA